MISDWKRRKGFFLNVIISDRINRVEGPSADGGALRLRLEAKELKAQSSELKAERIIHRGELKGNLDFSICDPLESEGDI